jgi:hypothetical protein
MTATTRAKAALLDSFTGATNDKGYTQCPQDNLLPGVDLADVESDLRRGDGNELDGKFLAVHSSAALAVNCFAPFKRNSCNIMLCGIKRATSVEFEKQLRIFGRGTAPNIDVWIVGGSEVVAVESKLLEYLTKKKPTFSDAYEKLDAESECCWWNAYEQAKQGGEQHVDRAQLIKHYFGLNRHQKESPERKLTLLYLFWEPLNWQEVAECRQHREELRAFAEVVSASHITFRWMPYTQLWEEWSAVPALEGHVRDLKDRYQVCI